MIEHIVLLKMNPGVTDTQVEGLLDDWRALCNYIPGVREVVGGRNVSIEPFTKGFTHGFIVRFETKAARDAYVPHPKHEEFAKTGVLPLIDDVCVVDIEV